MQWGEVQAQTSVKGPFSGPDHRKFDSRFSTVAAAIEDRPRTGPLHEKRATACDCLLNPHQKQLIWGHAAPTSSFFLAAPGFQFASSRPFFKRSASTLGGSGFALRRKEGVLLANDFEARPPFY